VASELNRAVGDGPGPFWGVPPRSATEHLTPTKAPGFPHLHAHGALVEHRRAELALRDAGRRPFSVWQLLGAGSVGSQTLTAIPVLHHLRHHDALAARSLVWPFETGFVHDPTLGRGDAIVHAEIWPSSIDPDLTVHPVRDAAQVVGLARHLVDLDADDRLGSCFAPSVAGDPTDVLAEEGWILGAAAAAWLVPAPAAGAGRTG